MSQQMRKQHISDYETAYSASDFEVVQASYRKRLLLEMLEQFKPNNVIEVGCGFETIANVWQSFEQFTIIEPGARFAEKARVDTQHLTSVTVIEHFLEEATDVIKTTPDLILLSSLLHEVPDVEAFLLSAKKMCAKNTVIHINVPNSKSLHRLLALEMSLITTLDEPSELQKSFKQPRIFDLKNLKILVESLGFEVISEGSFFVKPFTHAQMQLLKNTGFMHQKILDGLWGLAKHIPEYGSEIYINIQLKDQ